MSLLRIYFFTVGLLASFVLTAQSCPDESGFNDPSKYFTYGSVTGTTVGDGAGVCGDAIRLTLGTTQPSIYNAGWLINESHALPDRANKIYRVTFRYRAGAPRRLAYTVASRRNGTTTNTTDYENGILDVTTSYQTYSVVINSARQLGENDHHLYLLLMIGDSQVPLYIDDIVMEEIPCTEDATFSNVANTNAYGGATSARVDDVEANCGTAIRLGLNAVKPQQGSAGVEFKQQHNLVDEAGKTYRISFRYRADANRQVGFSARSRRYNTFGTDDQNYENTPLDATTGYRRYTTTFTSLRQPGETGYRVFFVFTIGNSTVPVYIDDISVEEVPCTAEGTFNALSRYETYNDGAGTLQASEVYDLDGSCRNAIQLKYSGTPEDFHTAGFQIQEDEGLDDIAGRRYRISFRYRAGAARPVHLSIRSRKRGSFGSDDEGYITKTLDATTTYQRYTANFYSKQRVADIDRFISMIIYNGNSNVPVYLDDIAMEELPPHHTSPGVYYVNPQGNDGNTGLANTAGQALRTLTYAFGALVPGDVLYVADGTYRQDSLTIVDLKGTAGTPTLVRAINPWGAVIEGKNSYTPVVKVEDSDHVTIEGFEVFNPLGDFVPDWSSGIQAFGSNHVTIRDNYIHDCGCNGISGREGDYLTIERNVVRDNAKTSPYNCSGISIYQPVQLDNDPGAHLIVRENVAFENECRLPFTPGGATVPTDGNGIMLDDFNWTQGSGIPYTAGVLVENNLTFSNGGAGIKTFEVRNATVRNNTAYKNNYVLEEFTPNSAEYNFQGFGGTINVYNNLAHQAFGRRGHAFSAQAFGQSGTINTNNNLWLGSLYQEGGTLRPTNDRQVPAHRQSYTAFGDALAAIPDFTSVDDFKPLFGLRAASPALNVGNDALAPTADLVGTPRPRGGATDVGAFEGAVVAGGPLPEDAVQLAPISRSFQSIAVDGKKDNFYLDAPQAITKSLLGSVPIKTDLAASWTAAWTADSLYLVIEVTDDILINDSGSSLEDDGISVFIDGDNAKSNGSYDTNDYHFVLGYGNGTIVEDGSTGNPTGFYGRTVATQDGYTAELALPLAFLGIRAERGTRLGIEVIVNDDDGGGTLEHQLSWQARLPGAAVDPSVFGVGELIETLAPPPIPYTATPIRPDGFIGSRWRGSPIYTLDNSFYETIVDADDLSATWRALWDDDNLYLAVYVRDDDLRNDSPDWFRDDGVEIYLDLDNSKLGSYGPNDYQLSVDFETGETMVVGRQGALGPGAVADIWRSGNGDYSIEVALPWTALNATPEAGLFIGIDVHVQDDDGGGNRNSKLTWYAPTDEAFRNPSLFGTAYLAPDHGGKLAAPGCFQAEAYDTKTGNITEFNPGDFDATNAINFATAGAQTTYTLDASTAGLHTLSVRCRTTDEANLDLYIDGRYANRIRVRPGADEFTTYETFFVLPEQPTTLTVRSREANLIDFNFFCLRQGHTGDIGLSR